MSEDERAKLNETEEQQDEVEAHKRHAAANDEGGETEGGEDDFEAHRHSLKAKHRSV